MGTRIGMVRCEHCGRQFNPHSAARHIPWCEKQKQERNKHRLSSEKRLALERYKWRISYRPSNQLTSGRHESMRRQASSDFGDKAKKSSLNSSATMSSPSASSSASLSIASTANDGYLHGRRQQGQQKQQQQQQRQRAQRGHAATATSGGQLQRSVSSLTLTKRPVRVSGEPAGGGDARGARADVSRTKSTNDLCNMGELVESLARRLEEIYAQNQLLLASIPKDAAAAANHPQLDSDNNGAEELLVKCHHCKAECADEANYCHRCGCKLRLASPSSSSAG